MDADIISSEAKLIMFKEIMIWKRLGDGAAIRYVCLKDLQSKKFAVQSADYFRLPLDEKQVVKFHGQFVELFIERSPCERCDWYMTLQDAISAHEQEFS